MISLLKIVLNPSNIHICIKWAVQQNLVMCHYDYSCYNSYVLTMVVERDCRGIGWYSEILI
jgi:hypothetical protein